MKITKQQIELLADAILKDVYNPDNIQKEKDKLAQPYLKEFRKSKIYKDLVKIFDCPYQINVRVFRKDFENLIPEELRSDEYFYYDEWNHCLPDIERSFLNYINRKLWKKYPNKEEVRQTIITDLTIKSIWGDDIYKILDSIKASVKKHFSL